MPRTRFSPAWADVDAAVQDARSRWAHLASPDPTAASFEHALAAHATIRAHAQDVSGGTHAAMHYPTAENNPRKAVVN